MSLASRLTSLVTRVANEIKAVRGVADSKVPLASVGVASGLATLDATGKLSSSQIPDVILGALKYQGVWNASTNSPVIPAASTANKGWYYIVNTAGGTSVNGVTDWQVGDWLVSNGTSWNKIDNTDQVMSVAGLQGAISAASLKAALAIAVADVSGLGTAATQASGAFAPAAHVGTGGTAHPAATTSVAGFMSTTDKTKLDGIAAGAQVNAVTSVAGKTGAVTLAPGDVGAQASNDNLSSLSGLALSSNKMLYATAAKTLATTDLSAVARTFLAQTSVTALWNIGLGAAVSGLDNGYQKLPNGIILQWGIVATGGTADLRVTFPTAFSNKCWAISAIAELDSLSGGLIQTSNIATNAFDVRRRAVHNGGVVEANSGMGVRWQAIGL